MFRTLRGIPLLGCLLGTLGCHGQSPAPPPIPKGDYGAIIRYLQARIPREMGRENVPGLSIALVNGQGLIDRKSTRLNSSHGAKSSMPSSA